MAPLVFILVFYDVIMTLAFRITFPYWTSVLYPILPIFNFTKLFPNWASISIQIHHLLLISHRLKDEMTSSVWLRLKKCVWILIITVPTWDEIQKDLTVTLNEFLQCIVVKLRSIKTDPDFKNGQVQFSHFRLSRLQTAPLYRFKAVRN